MSCKRQYMLKAAMVRLPVNIPENIGKPFVSSAKRAVAGAAVANILSAAVFR